MLILWETTEDGWMRDYKKELDKAIEGIRNSKSLGEEKKKEVIEHLEASKETRNGIEKFIDALRVKFEDIWEDIEPFVNELGLR